MTTTDRSKDEQRDDIIAEHRRAGWAQLAKEANRRHEFEAERKSALCIEMFGYDDPNDLDYGQRAVFNAEYERREATRITR